MPRQREKPLVGQLPGLDCRRIARVHGLTPGGFSTGHQFAAHLVDEFGRPAGSVGIDVQAADLVEVAVGQLVTRRWPVTVLRTSLKSNSGWRWWWGCPTCGRRCAILYVHFDKLPACRVCLGAAYRSQAQARHERALARALKIQRRIGWHDGMPCGRPKGMWTRTYARLTGQLEHAWHGAREEVSRWRRVVESGE